MLTVFDLYLIGRSCALARIRKRIPQVHVAAHTGYSVKTVSGFECGLNNNLTLFMYYFTEIMTPEDRADLLEKLGGENRAD